MGMPNNGTMQPADAQYRPSAVQLDESQFERVRSLARERFGLDIAEKKLSMVNNRLTKLMRSTGSGSLEKLIASYEQARRSEELLPLFDALSTNLTMFFREAEHFDLLRREIVEPASRVASGKRPRLRVWSAGCSKGCEPYTISMVLHDTLGDLGGWDARVLATDLAVSELRTARGGVYPDTFVSDLPDDVVARHFTPGVQQGKSCVRVNPRLAGPITFALLNLMEPWKLKGPFDAIFCRNVMIYFDEPTRLDLINRFKALIRPGGFLFLGTSEGLQGQHEDLLRVAPSAFRKL
jgi:chemotaxis protein methyltransferase CheR